MTKFRMRKKTIAGTSMKMKLKPMKRKVRVLVYKTLINDYKLVFFDMSSPHYGIDYDFCTKDIYQLMLNKEVETPLTVDIIAENVELWFPAVEIISAHPDIQACIRVKDDFTLKGIIFELSKKKSVIYKTDCI